MSEKLWNAILCLQSSQSSDVLNKFTCTVSECSWLEDYSRTGSSTRTKTNLMERGGFILLANGQRRKTAVLGNHGSCNASFVSGTRIGSGVRLCLRGWRV